MISNYNAILEDIGKIHFFKMKNLGDISACFYGPSRYLSESIGWGELRKKFLDLKDKICQYNVRCEGGRRILFLFSASYAGRRDYRKSFSNITQLSHDKIVMTPSKKSYKKIPNILGLGIIWFLQMSKVKASVKSKLLYVHELLWAYCNFLQIKDIINQNRNKIKMVFTYTDMHNIDAMVAMYANHLGIKTVTLQHGALNTNLKLVGSDLDSSGAMTRSKSNYMLMYGPQSVSYGEKLGINTNKLVSVGCAKNINEKSENMMKYPTSGVFAIVLDGRTKYNKKEIDINQKMIQMGEFIAGKFDKEFLVRRHPSDNYRYKIKSAKFKGYNSNKIDLSKLAQDIDFVIMGNSTAYYEFMYFMVPAFRYTYSEYNPFDEITWDAFKNYEELERLIQLRMNNHEECNNQMLRTREYLYQKGDVKKNFISFFEEHTKG